LLEQLIDALRILPGVGQKSAQRMAYHVLERDREGGTRLAEALAAAVERVGHCKRCRDFSETELCATCASAARDAQQLCAIESPADRLAIEQATGYRGLYFVLQGRLSPLDGIGPRELGLDQLADRLGEGEVQELIIATNPTVEGDATAHYLAQIARKHGVRPSRLAHGLPLGGELEYVDRGTLAHAFGSRAEIQE
jgi:recombination protein RecR